MATPTITLTVSLLEVLHHPKVNLVTVDGENFTPCGTATVTIFLVTPTNPKRVLLTTPVSVTGDGWFQWSGTLHQTVACGQLVYADALDSASETDSNVAQAAVFCPPL
jgi:hypothetical protein